MQTGAGHLGGIDDAGSQHVDVLTGGSVETFGTSASLDVLSHNSAVGTCVFSDAHQRSGKSSSHDVGADQFLAGQAGGCPLLQGRSQVSQGGATARNDAFLNSRLGGVDGVLETEFLVLHLGFGGRTHLHHSHATGQLGQAFLQLLLVVGGVGLVHLLLDLFAAGADSRLVALGNDGGGVLVDGDATGGAQHLELGVLQLETGIFGDQLTVGQHSHVFQHGLAAITKTRSLHSGHVQHTAQTVHHQSGQGFLLDVLSNDQQRLAGAGDLLQHGHQILHQTDLLVGEKDVRLVEDGFHPLGVGGEIRGDVALIEAHALSDLEFGLHGLALFEGNHTFLANLVHGIGNHLADFFIVASGDGADLSDGIAVSDGLGHFLDLADQEIGSLVDALLQGDGVGTGSHVAQTRLDHGVGQNGGGGGAVTCGVVGFGGGLTDQSNTGVLDVVFELDLLGDGDAVIDDLGCTELLLEHHVAALGAQGHGDGFAEDVDAFFESETGVLVVDDALCHGRRFLMKRMVKGG